MNRIFLIGYMGSGKTSIGKKLAKTLGYSFVDMDQQIELEQLNSVSQIFEEQGEAAFRLLEQTCLQALCNWENVVVATGGGAACYFDNMEYMNKHGLTVYLQLSVKELSARLGSSKKNKRPLIQALSPEELETFIQKALSKREAYYQQAKLIAQGTDQEIIAAVMKNTKPS